MSGARYSKDQAKAAARELLRGTITAICTPVGESGEIDEAGLRHDLRHCIDVIKSDGIYLHGYYGQFWLETSEQRRRATEIAVNEIAGAVPIINRCAHASPQEAIDLALHAQGLGVDFISLVIPQFGGAYDSLLVDYFAMIADEIELGITIFNTDQAGYSLTPTLMARLADIPNVCALKNGLPLEHTDKVREIVGDSIVVIDPNEENFLHNMLTHGQAAIYTGTNMMFDSAKATPMRDYVHAFLEGRPEDAKKLYEDLQPVRDMHRRWVLEPWLNSGLCPVSTVKYWTSQMGMTGGPTPRPLPDLLSPEDKDHLHADLVQVGLI